MAEGQAGRYGRPTRPANLGAKRKRAVPRLVISKEELAQQIGRGVARATTEALERERKRELRRSKRRAQADSGRFEKAGSADLARRMAAQAASTRQRLTIAELQARYEAERDPIMKSSLGQEITFERLRKAQPRREDQGVDLVAQPPQS